MVIKLGIDDAEDLAALIDHTLLKLDASESDIRKLCEEARTHQFATVCVRSGWVKLCKSLLEGSGVKTITVVGFPTGQEATPEKVRETRAAILDGADEIDMVINLRAVKDRDWGFVLEDIRAVVEAAMAAPVKVILETGALTDAEKAASAAICELAGARFVKTSTGFGPGGATVADVALLRSVVSERLEIKASGGIRSLEDALALVKAGATRLGTSSGVKLVQGLKADGSY